MLLAFMKSYGYDTKLAIITILFVSLSNDNINKNKIKMILTFLIHIFLLYGGCLIFLNYAFPLNIIKLFILQSRRKMYFSFYCFNIFQMLNMRTYYILNTQILFEHNIRHIYMNIFYGDCCIITLMCGYMSKERLCLTCYEVIFHVMV